ncbi:MAG TPA: DUF47 family protein [Verrucomicrobiae bacterium]|jgi:hypothetical protein|nr:DUF47 family protein [Verrucomicrobiae bacterium]
MFSLQKLLGKEDMFFDLLEASAEEARASVQALVKLNKNPEQTTLLYEFIQARRKEKQIRAKITEAVYNTFVTALEREDIESLSHALYRIPKTVEKFGERLLLAPQYAQGVDFSKQVNLLEQATDTVCQMVKSLRQGASLEKIMALNDKLQYLEGEADKTVIELLRGLLNAKHDDPIKVIVLKDLYEVLEKVIDRCRDVGNIIAAIILKNS